MKVSSFSPVVVYYLSQSVPGLEATRDRQTFCGLRAGYQILLRPREAPKHVRKTRLRAQMPNIT